MKDNIFVVRLIQDGEIFETTEYNNVDDAIGDAMDTCSYQRSFRLNDDCDVYDRGTGTVVYSTKEDPAFCMEGEYEDDEVDGCDYCKLQSTCKKWENACFC